MLENLLLAMLSAGAIALTLSVHFSLSFLEVIAVYSGSGTALVFAFLVAIAFVRRESSDEFAVARDSVTQANTHADQNIK